MEYGGRLMEPPYLDPGGPKLPLFQCPAAAEAVMRTPVMKEPCVLGTELWLVVVVQIMSCDWLLLYSTELWLVVVVQIMSCDWLLLYSTELWLVVVVQIMSWSVYVGSWHSVRPKCTDWSRSDTVTWTWEWTAAEWMSWRCWNRGCYVTPVS